MGSHYQQGPCHRCGRSGHLARGCSQHTCFRCNGMGHMAWECVEGVICGKCGEKGHLQRNCKNISCHKCGRKGHISRFCNDPFAKAAEVEKHERLRALASARTPISSLLASRESCGGTVTRETTSLHKDVRGPWDGLGVHRRDMVPYESQHTDQTEIVRSQDAACLLNSRKRLAPCSVQTVMSRRLKSVDVKPDTASQKNVASSIGFAKEGESTSTPQWEGLVGYSSEGSEDN